MRRLSLLVVAAVSVLSACGEGAASTSTSTPRRDDAGAEVIDAGSDFDAGVVTLDAGVEPQEDAGLTEFDAGVMEQDAGSMPQDAGQPQDAGTMVDAGAPWPDPGTMTAGARLYTSDGTSFTIDRVDAALAHALAGQTTRHVIFYVHGRACGGGGEPTKSLGEAIPELEADYSARVVMFTWPGSSNGCPLGFPEQEARDSGAALRHTIHKLAAKLGAQPVPGLTLTLITHSLGNIVLEEALATATSPWPPGLFGTVMLNSSATAASGHQPWLSRLSFSPNVYVSVNSGDSVLGAAGVGRSTRLGKSIDNVTLAANTKYLDVSAANVNHAYYLHGGMKGAGMRSFYDAVMRGRAWTPVTAFLTRTESRNGTVVYVLNGT